MAEFEKIVIVTKKTPLEELVERFGTKEQAEFYIRQSGGNFTEYEDFHAKYESALERLKRSVPEDLRYQVVDRGFLPNFVFDRRDLVTTLGPDGLVVNVAKYVQDQPILAFNPDPTRIDGVLVLFQPRAAQNAFIQASRGRFTKSGICMAQVTLNDGQRLYALNDLFIGQRTHVSARYRIRFDSQAEDQSSSGIIVSTGAGSTGWFRSILTGSVAVASEFDERLPDRQAQDLNRWNWEEPKLAFSVREPFISKASRADLVFGWITEGQQLEVVSRMPQNGVIFSDGVEEDFLNFNSGAIASIGVADRRVNLITKV